VSHIDRADIQELIPGPGVIHPWHKPSPKPPPRPRTSSGSSIIRLVTVRTSAVTVIGRALVEISLASTAASATEGFIRVVLWLWRTKQPLPAPCPAHDGIPIGIERDPI